MRPYYEAGPPADEPTPTDLVRELREALGLPAGAMPLTPKAAWEEALRMVRATRGHAFLYDPTCPRCVIKAIERERDEARAERNAIARENGQLRAALEPFASGVGWGALKAWIVEGAEACATREAGVAAAAQLTRWSVAVDAALAPRPTPPGDGA